MQTQIYAVKKRKVSLGTEHSWGGSVAWGGLSEDRCVSGGLSNDLEAASQLEQGSPTPRPLTSTGLQGHTAGGERWASEQSFICRSPWLPMAPHGSPSLPVIPHRSPWLPIAPLRSPSLPMAPHGSPSFPIAPHGSPWLPVAPHRSPWLPIAHVTP